MRKDSELSREAETALGLLTEREGIAFELVGRYGRGESRSAYRVADQRGRYFALKVAGSDRIRRAVATTERLRGARYPAPAYLRAGAVSDANWYALIEELPGAHPASLANGLAEQALALIEGQAGLAFLPVEGPRIVDTLLFGADGYALHETMRTHSMATSSLLDEIVAIGRRYFDLDFPSADIVHGDFSHANVLVLDGKISGVVDWEGADSGDRAFDIATLLFYELEDETAQQTLWDALLKLTGPHRTNVYLAHMMLRQVEWSARNHAPSAVERFLSRSERLLSELKAL
jgi:hypothetical protein